ncbi:MAG TPA: GH32 C-terminal domain-containing protein, partial [Pirellulaceae bacterium]|nr:GH32 C-terminal domain-containing protein [Pirellulaceae bacterium]
WNEGRAVVPNQGFDSGERDPKVFWHEASQRWVMVLWVQRNPGRVRFFTSKNLTDWEFASDLMRDWAFECMDLVFLPVDGDPTKVKCLIYDASFDYEIGTFDGKEFHSETEPLKISRGNFYAAQTFNNAPDGRVVQIGWMRGGPNAAQAYELPYNQQMSFPYELSLRTTSQGVRLNCWPIKEIESLTKRLHHIENVSLAGDSNALADISGLDLVDLTIEFEPGTATQVVFDLPGIAVRYDAKEQVLMHNGIDNEGQSHDYWTIDKIPPRDGVVQLRLLVDRMSLEAFAFGGETFGAHYFNPKLGPAKHSIHAVGGEAKIRRLELRELNSAW